MLGGVAFAPQALDLLALLRNDERAVLLAIRVIAVVSVPCGALRLEPCDERCCFPQVCGPLPLLVRMRCQVIVQGGVGEEVAGEAVNRISHGDFLPEPGRVGPTYCTSLPCQP